jgi:hypothetical protein
MGNSASGAGQRHWEAELPQHEVDAEQPQLEVDAELPQLEVDAEQPQLEVDAGLDAEDAALLQHLEAEQLGHRFFGPTDEERVDPSLTGLERSRRVWKANAARAARHAALKQCVYNERRKRKRRLDAARAKAAKAAAAHAPAGDAGRKVRLPKGPREEAGVLTGRNYQATDLPECGTQSVERGDERVSYSACAKGRSRGTPCAP